ncbi:MAG: hypothetical protein PHT33_03770 [bacterium]|nr:hypothetical protein [bacterium]
MYSDIESCLSLGLSRPEDLQPHIRAYDGREKAPAGKDSVDLSLGKVTDMDTGVRLLELRLSNMTGESLWLEVRFGISLSDYSGLTYWDGLNETPVNGKAPLLYACNADPFDGPIQPLPDKVYPEIYDELEESFTRLDVHIGEFAGIQTLCQFPAAALYNRNACVGIGLDPRTDFSYFSSGINADQDGFYFAVKTVLEPKETDAAVNLLLVTSEGTYGKRHILDAYYKAFPALYELSADVDQRFMGPAETFKCYQAPECGNILLEDFRRYHTSWVSTIFEWFQYDGMGLYLDEDVVGGDFLQRVKDSTVGGKSIDEAHRLIREGNSYMTLQSASLLSQTYENGNKGLVKRLNMEDAVIIRSNGKVYDRHEQMNGDSYVMSARGSYLDFLKENIRKAVEEYRPDGLYVDNCQGPRPDFNPAIPRVTSRAFTDGQTYITQGYGNAALLNYMKSFVTENGRRMAALSNTPNDYMVTRESDAALVEYGPWMDDDKVLIGLRCLMGKKPIVQWGPKGFLNYLSYPEDEAAAKMDHYVRLTRLYAIHTGCMLNTAHAVRGYPESLAWLPLIEELARLGWEPVTNATVDNKDLKLERFGRFSYSVVNFSDREQAGTVTVNAGANNEGVYIYKKCDPAFSGLETVMAAGEGAVTLTLPALSAQMLHSVMALKTGVADSGRAMVSIDGDDVCEVKLEGLEGCFRARFMKKEGYDVKSVTVDGRELDLMPEETDNSRSASVTASGSTVIRIEYAAKILVDKSAVGEFAFFNKKQGPGFSLACPDIEHPVFQLQKERLLGFLRYYAVDMILASMSDEQRHSFDKGNHDTRMTLRRAAYAPDMDLDVAAELLEGGGQIVFIAGEYIEWMRANLGTFDPDRNGVYRFGPGSLICYSESIADFSLVIDELLRELDGVFPLYGEQRWRERRFMKARFWNLHVAT